VASIQFLGAAGTVTGSKYLVEGEVRFLVDCGLFQGAKKLRELNWQPSPVPPASIDHVVLTHAHIDHVGALPILARDGFKGPVWCTPATRELTEITLLDAAHLQEEDARFANEKGFSKHQPALPLYTTGDAERAIGLLRALDYEKETALAGATRIRFRDAGHILGSGIVEAVFPSGAPGGKEMKIVFSGDLGRYHARILRDPEPVEGADYLVVESTYGNRIHPVDGTREGLAALITETARRGGSLVVPAFAIGRTQTLLYVLRELKAGGLIPDLPVYVDSPMAVDVTQLFCDYIEDFDQEARDLYHKTGQCPVLVSNLHLVRDTAESKKLAGNTYPSIIISASGMATGGRILHHLAERLPDARNTVLFMGFQAYGTRGQMLKDGAKEIKIHGAMVPVRARIRSVEAFSAHADRSEILEWLGHFKTPPRRTFIVHGEPEASAALAEEIRRKLGWQTHVAEYLERVELA
jgi:metallo-beta-lactamase family protein